MRWPWRRNRGERSGEREASRSTAPPAAADPRPSPAGWAFLPPIQRTLSDMGLVSRPHGFLGQLPVWADPTLTGPMVHLVDPRAPAGLVDGDGRHLGSPSFDDGGPELTLRPPTPPRVSDWRAVQRSVATTSSLLSGPDPRLPVRQVEAVPAPPGAVEPPAAAGPAVGSADVGLGAELPPVREGVDAGEVPAATAAPVPVDATDAPVPVDVTYAPVPDLPSGPREAPGPASGQPGDERAREAAAVPEMPVASRVRSDPLGPVDPAAGTGTATLAEPASPGAEVLPVAPGPPDASGVGVGVAEPAPPRRLGLGAPLPGLPARSGPAPGVDRRAGSGAGSVQRSVETGASFPPHAIAPGGEAYSDDGATYVPLATRPPAVDARPGPGRPASTPAERSAPVALPLQRAAADRPPAAGQPEESARGETAGYPVGSSAAPNNALGRPGVTSPGPADESSSVAATAEPDEGPPALGAGAAGPEGQGVQRAVPGALAPTDGVPPEPPTPGRDDDVSGQTLTAPILSTAAGHGPAPVPGASSGGPPSRAAPAPRIAGDLAVARAVERGGSPSVPLAPAGSVPSGGTASVPSTAAGSTAARPVATPVRSRGPDGPEEGSPAPPVAPGAATGPAHLPPAEAGTPVAQRTVGATGSAGSGDVPGQGLPADGVPAPSGAAGGSGAELPDVFGEPALDVSTTIGALGPPPAPLAPTVLRLAFAAPATPAGRAGGVDEAGAGGGPGAAPSPRPEFPAPRPEFPAPRPESPAAPGPSTPAVAREPGARSAAAAPPVVLRAVATGAVPSVLGPAAPFAASASRGPAGTGTLPLATADLSVESARAGDGSATAPPWTGRAAQAWPVQRLGARGPAPLVLPPAGPHLAPVPESPVVEAPVAVQRASEPPAPVQPAAQAGAPAPSGGGGTAPAAGPDQIDELVRRLAGPMLRRVKAELLLDRERRGVRTDIG